MRFLIKPALELAEGAMKNSARTSRSSAKMLDEVYPGSLGQFRSRGKSSLDDLFKPTNKGSSDRQLKQLDEGDLVGIAKPNRVEGGTVFRVFGDSNLALVKPLRLGKAPKSKEVSVNPDSLFQVSNRIFTDKAGRVFSSRKNIDLDDLSDAEKLIYNPSLIAVHRSKLKSFVPPKTISPQAELAIAQNRKLIEASIGNSDDLLASLSQAPKIQFGNPSLFSQRPVSAFNPTASLSNCMSCTASTYRTLKEGRLYTPKDIANLTARNGQEKLGYSTPGRFLDEHEALDWFSQAANASLRIVGRKPSLERGQSFAAITKLPGNTSSSVEHMFFGHRLNNGKMLYYDGQKGVTYSWQSINTGRNPVSFYELRHPF